MAQLIRVFAVDETNSLDFEGLLYSNLGMELLGTSTSYAQAQQKLSILIPDLVLYHSEGLGDEFASIEKLALQCPQATIIVLATSTDAEYVRKCLRAGAQDYILLPIDGPFLQTEMQKAFDRNRRRNKHETLSVLMDRFTGGPKILTFMSSKGGVGKTTLAVNLAVALAQMEKRVVLVDMNLQAGNVDSLLGLKPRHTVADLIDTSVDDLATSLPPTLERHDSGLFVLCAPLAWADTERISIALVRVILQTLQKDFEYVIVDLSSAINSLFLSVFEMSNECLVVSTPNLAVLKSNRNMLELMENLEYDLTKVSHILNCAGVKTGLKLPDIERLLKSDVRLSVEYNFSVAEQAVNQGVPVVLWRQQDKLTKSMYELAEAFTGGRRLKRDGKS